MRGEPIPSKRSSCSTRISTHSPHAGRTRGSADVAEQAQNFNSLAPCGANPMSTSLSFCIVKFQLTRPMRGEPCIVRRFRGQQLFQLTRPMRGEPFWSRPAVRKRRYFNSLAPCGANRIYGNIGNRMMIFQLTRPVRGEPALPLPVITASPISTHSPRAGRTAPLHEHRGGHLHFNSLAPCGANHYNRITKG